jgi:Putative nucleotidyltransferase DUF294
MEWQEYPFIKSCRVASSRLVSALTQELNSKGVPDGCCFAIFGSAGRREFGAHSDLDWTVLVRSDADEVGNEWRLIFSSILKNLDVPEPKAGGAFAGITVDYDIWRDIAQKTDHRSTLSKRMLLLLECVPLGDVSVYQNAVAKILSRYQRNESLIPGFTYVLPRYFLNDVLLFWRTMVTDYATSSRGPGWGLRALKMGMSRKILFLSGLLWTINARVDETTDKDPATLYAESYAALAATANEAPLERTKGYFAKWCEEGSGCDDPLIYYDRFLQVVHDRSFRKKLERSDYKTIRTDKDFLEAWSNVRLFHKAIIDILFSRDKWMQRFLQHDAFA